MKLYELTEQWNDVQALTEEFDPEVLKDTLESIEVMIDEKAESIAKIIKNNDAVIEAIKTEEERLRARKQALMRNTQYLKYFLQTEMEKIGKDKIQGDIFNINIQNNPPSVNVVDEKLINRNYFVEQAPKLDRKALSADLKNGLEVDGAELYQGRSLRIR